VKNPLCFVVFALSILLSSFCLAENWPAWRGPDGNGICHEKNLPTSWSAENVQWRVPMPGESASTPAVWNDHIFLTAVDGDTHVAYCFGTDGKKKWQHVVNKPVKVVRGGEGNSACISPITDGEHVWFKFSTGDVLCFDFDGKKIWEKNLQDEYGRYKVAFVISATPVLHEDKWLYQVTHEKTPYVLALDKKTGKELWKVPRKTDARAECEHAYTSPILYRGAGADAKTQLISHGSDYVIGYNIADGRELWRSGELQTDPYHKTLRFIACPTAVPGQIVVPSAKNQMIISVNPEGASGDINKSNKNFQWSIPKGTPDVPAPLIADGVVYICREKAGIVNAYDAKTGEEIYTDRIHGGLYRASPILADGHIYFTCRDGTVTVVKAGRTFKKVSENKLHSEPMTAAPAISNGVIYLHTHKSLYAVK